MILIILMTMPPALGELIPSSKVLLLGSIGQIPLIGSWFEADPLTYPTYVPCSTHLTNMDGDMVKRFIRLYFPRNYDKLLEYEYMVMPGMDASYFTQKQQNMIHDSILNDGLGAMQTRSVQSMASFLANEWASSIISDAFPNDADAVVSQRFAWEHLRMRFVINTNPNIPPIFTPYKDLEGVEPILTPGTTVIAIPKEGAVVTSYTIGNYPSGYPGAYPDPGFKAPGWMPHTMYWTYGRGTTWTHHDMLGGDNYWQPAINPYVPDMIMAEFIFATGRELPEDVMLLHRLRRRFLEFRSTRGFIYSLLDFIDRFGANTDVVASRVAQISKSSQEGEQLYLQGNHVESRNVMISAQLELEATREDAMKLKDQALMWTYVIEWITVSGTLLLVGFALWTLMVRRRLYREVSTTRLLQMD
ncbi:MAG: hypothetical protein HXS50_01285 [Theionarchaea archaeon]|nr:hypothetical protein [Theionarchaea archaeon]